MTIDVNTSADRTTAATTASPAFSTAAPNELLPAFVATDATSGTTAMVTNLTGAGLAWSLVVRSNAQSGTSEISNASWTASGKYGAALSFNGTSAWVTIAMRRRCI